MKERQASLGGAAAAKRRAKRPGLRHEDCGGALSRLTGGDYRCAACKEVVYVGEWGGVPVERLAGKGWNG